MTAEPPRVFEPAEAEALLPELDRALASAQELLARFDKVTHRRSEATPTNGHVVVNGSSRPTDEATSLQAQLRDILRRIEAQGVIVRDVQIGLIDFPAIREGQPIFLCWQRGEALHIEWWHPRSTGIAGRRRL